MNFNEMSNKEKIQAFLLEAEINLQQFYDLASRFVLNISTCISLQEGKNDDTFQLSCLLRTIEQLLFLAEEILKLLENRKLQKSFCTEILLKLRYFLILYQQFIFPENSWSGQYQYDFIKKWDDIGESLFRLGTHLKNIEESFENPLPITIDNQNKKILEIPVSSPFGKKKISVIHGDLCRSSDEYDIVVCSSYKNGYAPTPGTLIGSLLYQQNISVYMLSQNCELNLREHGAWLSRETGSHFHRIACIELLNYYDKKYIDIVNLKCIFSTLNYILEQAALAGISVKKVVLPMLGAGHQSLDTSYILSPLLTYCIKALKNIDETEEIIFYEKDEEKSNFIADRLRDMLTVKQQEEVFISYSSKQYAEAMAIYEHLTKNAIKCWMAPQSIPTGSQYHIEIPKAIHNVKILVLLLTQDAINSVFVPKEVGASLGARKKVMPFQIGEIKLENGFDFLLEGEQITIADHNGKIDLDFILQEVMKKLFRT
ncbi:MAG: toll/interleukin-1 receptor domain-containing protein [Oscillospiraceae bacterium]|nr:toll/interleukin-1 receptor domain-containing protein [Oscillospiraceae bacterium]